LIEHSKFGVELFRIDQDAAETANLVGEDHMRAIVKKLQQELREAHVRTSNVLQGGRAP
jgi:hypothetical protein